MDVSNKILTILKRILIVFLILVAVISGVFYFGAQPYLNKHLSEFITKKTRGLYQFGFNNIELQFIKKGLIITDINLSYDLKIAKEIQAINPEKVFYSFSSPELRIDNINLLNYFFGKNIRIKNLTVVNPRLKLTGPELFGNDSAKVFKYALNEIRPFFSRFVHSISIDEIEFIDANYQLFNLIGDTARVSNAEKVSVGITGFRTDSVKLSNYSQPFETDDIFMRLIGFKNEMSDSIHFLEIDSLEYSLKNEELKAFRSHLYPKIKTGENSLYDVFIPKFNMRSNNLSGFRFADTLKIAYLEFLNPVMTYTQKYNPRRLDIEDINNFDLYELIKNDFSNISIDSFYLKNAQLTIFKRLSDTVYQQKFNDIDIHLLNFKLDSVSDRNISKLLYADDIEMKVRGYELNLEDNFHRFTTDSIYVSTFSDSVVVSRIKITPLKNITRKAPIILNIECKNVLIDNIDLKQVYHRRIIPESIVEISNPVVTIENYPDLKERKDQPELLFELVSAYLKGVYSNLIHIEKGSLSFRNYSKGKAADNFEADFSFTLTDFSLDSASLKRTDKLFYATNFDLNFSDYSMHFADNLHKLDVKNIRISSIESSVFVDSLHLYPAFTDIDESMLKKYNRSELYDISVPAVTLQNADLHKAFFQKDLNIYNFIIQNPRISYENFATLKNRLDRLEFSELYELIFNYVQDISIINLIVPSGEVKWVNHSKKGKTITLDNHFSTELNNFRLNRDELGKQKLLFSEQLQLSLMDPLFSLSDSVHYLKAGQIDFSTKEKRIVISNALLYPDITAPEFQGKPTTIQVAIPRLTLDQVDLVEAWYSKRINVGEIFITSPKLEVYAQKDRTKTLGLKKFSIPLPKLIESLKVGKLHLLNGQVINYQVEGIHHSQNSSFNLDLNSENILITHSPDQTPNNIESGNIVAKMSDFQLVFNDKSHEARFDELTYNKQSKNIGLKNFRIIPSNYGQPSNAFNIQAPVVTLSGFDIEKAYENNSYIFETIKFDSPAVNISLADSISNSGLQKFGDLNLYDYLEPYFNILEIGEFSLTGAGIKLKSAKTELAQDNINISIKNIAVGKNSTKHGLLNSDGFEFVTFNYSKTLADKNYIFKIDTIKYSSFSNIAEFRSISIKPGLSKEIIAREKGFQVDVAEAKIGSATLQGFDFDEWLDERIIKGSKLTIGPASINIFRDKHYPFNKNQRPLWPQQLLSKIKQPFEIDSVYLQPSSVIYSELLESADEPVVIDFSEITARIGKISNLTKFPEGQKNLNIAASGKVLKVGVLNLTVDFNLYDPDFSHHVKGGLSPIKMNVFNGIVEKNSKLTVEEGRINQLDFDFNADENKATGELWFDYDQLKITVLNYRNGDTVKSVLSTFMANNFIVNSKNPRGKTLNPEKIDYLHDPSRSILNYWWKSIYSSSKIILGIKDPKENKK